LDIKDVLKQAKDLLKVAQENPEQFDVLTKAKIDDGKSPGQKQNARSSRQHSHTDALAVKQQIRHLADKHGFSDVPVAGVVNDKSPKPKLTKDDEMDEHAKRTAKNQRLADIRDKKIKKSDVPKEEQGGQISSEPTPAHGMKKGDLPTDIQGGQISSESTPSHSMKKDAMAPAKEPAAKPAAAKPMPDKGAQAQPAHAANAGGTEHIHHALKICDTPEKQKQLLQHLKSIHEAPNPAHGAPPHAGGAPAPAQHAAPAPAMKAEDILAQARILLKAAKDDPKQFEELTKAFGAPGAGAAPVAKMPKQAMPKPGMSAPAGAKPPAPGAGAAKIPGVGQPPKPGGGMRMSKEEIHADLAKPWSPKHMKRGC
jgi:hypothetical protein